MGGATHLWISRWRWRWSYPRLLRFVTGPGNQPVGWEWTPKTDRFGSRPVHSYLWLSVSGFTYMVAFRYATVDRTMLNLVRHDSFSTY
jgi:hypothetical protein